MTTASKTRARVRAARLGESFKWLGETETVALKCGLKPGRWICLTHPDDGPMNRYPTQLQKDFHIGTGRHVLAWICAAHGPEVP
jgi:hypothetical protein